jgi:hypothetical protein
LFVVSLTGPVKWSIRVKLATALLPYRPHQSSGEQSIAQKGHWQLAVPVFFMGASNDRVDMANSVYVIYASRDISPSHPSYNPMFYFRYRDAGGTMRKDFAAAVPFATQYEFLLGYDGYTRTMWWEVFDAMGTSRLSANYALGPGETFTLGKVGAGAWGYSSTAEPSTIGSTDNIYFDANMARNGNFEFDNNSDGTPDNWQAWTGGVTGAGTRSLTRAKFGTYSHKLADSSSTSGYGLQTVRMSASADKGYVASTWVYVVTGRFDLYLEFYNALSGGQRVGVGVKSSTTTGTWEYLDLTMIGPQGTVAVDLLVYSSTGNTGTGYFDGAEVRPRRSFWSVNNHDGDAGPDLPGWARTFDRAAELGASYVRTDLRWSWFEHEGDEIWDNDKITYWSSVIRMGKTRGIDVIPILNGPRPDKWLPSRTDPNRFVQFGDFCKKMAQEFGPDIYYWNILNEPNWRQEVSYVETEWESSRLTEACYDGLIIGEGVNGYTHKSAFKSVVNVLANYGDWGDFLRNWLNDAGSSIDVPGIDHYPATKVGAGNCDNWAPLDGLLQIMRDYSKEGAIVDTGYSSWGWPGHTEQDQENWMNCALPIVRDKAKTHNLNYPLNFLLFGSLYELFDQDSDSWGTELDTYGIVYWNCDCAPNNTEKPAYNDFRAQVAAFGF